MKIKVVSAIGGDELVIDLSANSRVSALKEEVSKKKNIPIGIFVLAYRGMELDLDQSIQDAGIQNDDKVYVITRTEGGYLYFAF